MGGAARHIVTALLAAGALLGPASAAAERPGTTRLPQAEPHWIWVADLAFSALADGRSWLVDADSGELLGFVAAGYWHIELERPRGDGPIVSPQTHFSRTTRGERTDVVTLYDPHTLQPSGEIAIPAKRATHAPMPHSAALTDDGRFLAVYNYTPGQSLSIVDLEQRRFVGEVDTAGCVLAYPAGERRVATLCGNGRLSVLDLDDSGRVAARTRTERFFDPDGDFVLEKAVRVGKRWLFVSQQGHIHPVRVPPRGDPSVEPSWSLFDATEREAGWKVGGTRLLAAHAASGRLFVLVHQGGPDTHKSPGVHVFVYDLERQERVDRIQLAKPAVSIAVTPDDEPLLVTVLGEPGMEVYDADSGEHLRSVEGLGISPLMVNSAVRAGSVGR